MKPHSNKAIRKMVRGYFHEWREPLGLIYWSVLLDYTSSLDPTISGVQHMGAATVCESKWQYSQATLLFSYPRLRRCEPWEIERLVVHEMFHMVLDELRGKGFGEHLEHVTEHLTSVALRCEKKGEKSKEKEV